LFIRSFSSALGRIVQFQLMIVNLMSWKLFRIKISPKNVRKLLSETTRPNQEFILVRQINIYKIDKCHKLYIFDTKKLKDCHSIIFKIK
jgi:hypothetical protein